MTLYAQKQLAYDLVRLASSLVMALEDVYNMNETSIILPCPIKQDTKHKEKSVGVDLEGPSYSCSCYEHNRHWQVKLVIIYKSLRIRYLERWCANKLCVVVCKHNNLDDFICIWELDDVHECTCQILKVEGTLIYGQLCYSFPSTYRGEFGISTL